MLEASPLACRPRTASRRRARPLGVVGATFAVLPLALLSLAACGSGQGQEQAGPAGPPEVGFVTIRAESVELTTELPGRTRPYAISEVRPQVAGIVQARLFTEGGRVRAGQTLYEIDPAPYEAALARAEAELENARATVESSRLRAERYRELAAARGISRQEADDAAASYGQARAQVKAAEAAVRTARLELGYTRVRAPISGRIGRSLFTQGALVTASQEAPLTNIQQLDPIYVDVSQSTAELLRLRRGVEQGQLSPRGDVAVRLKLEDGSDYPIAGRLQFADVTVNEATGAVTLRALFPNPENVLLPGMFVRAVVPQGTSPLAVLAPQQGVSRDRRGMATALVVNAEDRIESRDLVTDAAIEGRWLVTRGLRPGDRLVVEGSLRVQPGAKVRPVPVRLDRRSQTAGPATSSG